MLKEDLGKLIKIAQEIRLLILKTTHTAGCGHTGGSLSEADILTALYFNIMNIDPANPGKTDRDRFILSKGHATPGFYSTLARRGFFPVEVLSTFDKEESILQGHPDMNKTPGVDMTTGSLGQGLSCGVGMAIGGEDRNNKFYTYVLLGDGECQEGQVWETALFAGSRKVKRIIAITDYNKVQLASTVDETSSLEPLEDKWKAFGWTVLRCDGHAMEKLVETLNRAKKLSETGPVAIIADTVKGKGVSFMQNKWQWHGKAPNKDEYEQAVNEVSGGIK